MPKGLEGFQKGYPPWNKGLTKETDERVRKYGIKASQKLKGRIAWNKNRKIFNYPQCGFQKGHPDLVPLEARKRAGEKMKGRKFPSRSLETRAKMSKAKKGKIGPNKGKHYSEELKKKLSIAHKGKHFSEETRKKMSKAAKGKLKPWLKGEKAPNWRGGISFDLYPMDWTEDIREAIRKRDNYVCQMCGIHQDELKGWNRKLDVHHINYDKNNLNPENLISLCKSCHMKTNYNRKYWKIYFQKYEKEI